MMSSSVYEEEEDVSTKCKHCLVPIVDNQYTNCVICRLYYHHGCIGGGFDREHDKLCEDYPFYFICPGCDDRIKDGEFSYERLLQKYQSLIIQYQASEAKLDTWYVQLKEAEYENRLLEEELNCQIISDVNDDANPINELKAKCITDSQSEMSHTNLVSHQPQSNFLTFSGISYTDLSLKTQIRCNHLITNHNLVQWEDDIAFVQYKIKLPLLEHGTKLTLISIKIQMGYNKQSFRSWKYRRKLREKTTFILPF